MNILIFSWRGFGHPNSGGAEIATHEHAKAWEKAGHDVYVFTSFYKNCKKHEEIDGVHIIRRGRQIGGVQIAAFFWFLFGKHPKYDIVVDQFHGVPFFTPFYIRTKILAYIHEVAIEVWKENELPCPYNVLASFLGPRIEPLIFKFYKNIDFMTVSLSTKKDIISFGISKDKIHIIQNGIKKFTNKNLKREKILTFLGTLTKDKGVEDAIKIFSEVYRKDESWKLEILGKGSGDYMNYLKAKAKELVNGGKVIFEGYVNEQRKYAILSKSFCLLNPSIHEGWGLVNIEANTVGTPVFAYKVKGVSDSVISGKTGLLFARDDVYQVAMEILKLYNDKERFEIMSKNCIKWSQKFSWEKSTKESTALIESL